MKNIFVIIVISGFVIGCNHKKEPPKPKNIYEAIRIQANKEADSMASVGYSDWIFIVSYQKIFGKQFIAVHTSKYFNKDSVSGYEVYNDKLLVYYSKNYFQKYFPDFKMENLMKEYGDMAYKEDAPDLFDPQYFIFEITPNDSVKRLSLYAPYYSELFNYGDRAIPKN